jgi:hypothetical protein
MYKCAFITYKADIESEAECPDDTAAVEACQTSRARLVDRYAVTLYHAFGSGFDFDLRGCGMMVNTANVNKEKLAIEKKKILARKKEIEAELKRIRGKEKAVTAREETTIGMTFWRFFSKHHADEYEKIVQSGEFKEYVKAPYPRKLFGFDGLPVERGEKAGSDGEGRTYLDVPYSEKESAKRAGAKWDASARKWYVPDGADLRFFSAWLPCSGSGFSPAVTADETPESVPDSEILKVTSGREFVEEIEI